MTSEKEKAGAFVQHLLDNPALRKLTPLQKEEQIVNFLDLNASQLAPTLASEKFFPGLQWVKIRSILMKELYRLTDESLQAYLRRFIFEQVNLGYSGFLGKQRVPEEEMKTNLLRLLEDVPHKSAGRRALTGCFNALAYKIPDRYIDMVYSSKNYIRFELEKVQRLKMSKEEVKDMVKTSLLLRPAAYMLIPDLVGTPQTRMRGTFRRQAAEKVVGELEKRLPNFPLDVLKSGVESNLSFLHYSDIMTTARLTMLMSNLARDYRPDITVDRGAASPEKSWFSVARRNYRYFGYDIKMVDELYKIAAENGW